MSNAFDFLRDLKSEKRLSFSNWRYKVLHWAFRVSPSSPAEGVEAGIPHALYTHYCPLFHLTNLIVLFFPFIVLYRIFKTVVVAMATVFIWVAEHWPKKKFKEEQVVHETRNVTLEELKTKEKKWFVKYIKENKKEALREFEEFWGEIGTVFNFLSKDEVHEVWKVVAPKIIQKAERDKLIRARMVFWVTFSRGLIKVLMNVLYVVLTLGIVYVLYNISDDVLYLLSSMAVGVWNMGTLSFVLQFVSWTLRVVFALLVLFLIIRLTYKQVAGMLNPVGRAVNALGEYIINAVRGVAEFVSMFYEENCPPVVIVSEEEEELTGDL